MALHNNDDFDISISVEGPLEDFPYSFAQSMPTVEDDFLKDTASHVEDDFQDRSPFLFSPASPWSEAYSPSSESLYSFSSSIGSPLSYSPLSLASHASLDDTFEVPYPTVSPRDITSHTFESYFYSGGSTEYDGGMEPLFEDSVEDTRSQELVAIDRLDSPAPTSSTLFSPQRTTDLHITIPVMIPSPHFSAPSPHQHYSPSPGDSSSFSSRARSQSPSDSEVSSQFPDSPHQCPSPAPKYGQTQHHRQKSTSSESLLRVASPAKRYSRRHQPYECKADEPPCVAVAADASSMTSEEYKLVVSHLKTLDEFKDHDFTKELPTVVKPIVGSDQTRRASKGRRTDTNTFRCPIPGCGSTITKKHNLHYHLRSHFLSEPSFQCQGCSRGFAHMTSLQRHRKLPNSNERCRKSGRDR